MQRITGLVEIQRRKGKQVEPCFHQFRVAKDNFNSSLQLTLVPLVAFVRSNRRAQNSNPESRLPQDSLQPQRDILLARIGRVHLATPTLPEFLAQVGDEGAFLRIETILREILRRRHQKPHILFCLRVKGTRPDVLESIGMVGIE